MRCVRKRLYNEPKFHCIVLWLESGNPRVLIGVHPSTANCFRHLLYGSIFPPERALCHLLRQKPHAKSSTRIYSKRERWFSKLLNCRDKNVCLSYPNKRALTHYGSVVNKKLYKGSFNSVVLNRREFYVLLKSLFVTSRGYYTKLCASRYFGM